MSQPPRPHERHDHNFPSLPIITPDPIRRPESERYGGLYYLGAAGLIVVVGLLTWFLWAVWSHRAVWVNVYVLHDPVRSEADRVAAAYGLAHDPGVNQRQLWDIALRRDLPPLARYVVAEGLTEEAAAADPGGYGEAVARSEGWPVWLRVLLTRPLAYRAAIGRPVPRRSLELLARHDDWAVALWASFALAAAPEADDAARDSIRRAATSDGPDRPLAVLLDRALDARRLDERFDALDRATLWLRDHHPDASTLWKGWSVVDGRLVRAGMAPELQSRPR